MENKDINNEIEIYLADETNAKESQANMISASESNRSIGTSNTMDTAIQIGFDTWVSGSIICPDDEIWYKFTANQCGKYTIYTDGSLDTYGYLYDCNGLELCCNDDSVNGVNFSITYELNSGETYYVKVKSYKGLYTGDYCLLVSYIEDSTNQGSDYDDTCNDNTIDFTARDDDKYADHQKYHSFDAGKAGSGTINLYTGKLTWSHTDLTVKSTAMPISLSHLYNSKFGIENCGEGWKLSIEQSIQHVNNDGIIITYTDSQGKEHDFYDDGCGNIVDDMGLGLTFDEETNTIKDEKDTKMAFNSDGKLVEISDSHGNCNRITYSNGDLIGISDDKNQVLFTYEKCESKTNKRRIKHIVDADGDVILYDYDCYDRLISITYPSSDSNLEKTVFEYINGKLCGITDRSGISHKVTYNSDGMVSELKCTGNKRISNGEVELVSEENDDTLIFHYSKSFTAVTNERTGIKNVYRFDNNGRVTSTYTDMSEANDTSLITETTIAEIFDYGVKYDDANNATKGRYRSLSTAITSAAENQINLLSNGLLYNAEEWAVDTYCSSGEISSVNYIEGMNSYHFTNNCNSAVSKLCQNVLLDTSSLNGNILIASAWIKMTDVNSNAIAKLTFNIDYCNGTNQREIAYYDNTYSGWQYIAVPIAYKNDSCPIDASVTIEFSDSEGECYITNARLVAVEGTTVLNEYDRTYADTEVFGERFKFKRRVTKQDTYYKTVDYISEVGDTVLSLVYVPNVSLAFRTENKYDSEHNLLKTKDWRGIITENEYNEYGKLTKKKVYSENNTSQYKISEYKYYNNGLLLSESDPLNEYVKQYTYDMDNGLLKSTIDFNGQIYTNSYDSNTDEIIGLTSIDGNTCLHNSFEYTIGHLTKLTYNGFSYGFDFDALGRQTAVRIAGDPLLNKEYVENGTSQTERTVYANGEETVVVSDSRGNPISRTYKANPNAQIRELFTVEYNSAGEIKKYIDNEAQICYNYTYNNRGDVVRITESDMYGNILRKNRYTYDEKHKLIATTYGETGQKYTPIYDERSDGIEYPDDTVIGVTLEGKFTDITNKDMLGRLSERTLTVNNNELLTEEFTYLESSQNYCVTSDMVSEVRTVVNGTAIDTEYWYDEYGDIIGIRENGSFTSIYEYDKWHRLIRENNRVLNATYVWEYDEGGNILSKKTYPYSGVSLDNISYNGVDTYYYTTGGNRDRLEYFNGQQISYDALGNPTYYKGNNLEWTKVRKLAKYGENSFEYNASGLRIKKNYKTYVLDGDKIINETDYNGTLTYYYGLNGVIGFNYNGEDYYYRKNILGDVLDIYTASGTKVASYVYDAWGNHEITLNTNNIANINPIRYRSYYYDTETGLYYLQTRYYDPETGRFISPDSYDTLTADISELSDKNLYAYCGNNPISRKDNGGEFWHIVAGAAIGAIVGIVGSLASQKAANEEIDPLNVAISAISGALSGGLAAAGVPMGAMVAVNATLGAAESVYDNLTNGEPDSLGEVITDAAVSAGISAVFTLVGGKSNGKQMNAMYKANRQATKILTNTKGLNPKVKKELLKPIKTYFKTLGRYIVSEAKESPLSAFSSWGVNKLVEGTIDSYTGW